MGHSTNKTFFVWDGMGEKYSNLRKKRENIVPKRPYLFQKRTILWRRRCFGMTLAFLMGKRKQEVRFMNDCFDCVVIRSNSFGAKVEGSVLH